MSGSPGPSKGGGGGLQPQQKSKRKISLPWFRQSSVAKNHPMLTRQHTIDTPGSFQARLLKRQPSQSAMTGAQPEMTWVVSDYTAASTSELSVTKGQQVEVVEVCLSRPDYCLVRMPAREQAAAAVVVATSGGEPAQPQPLEGLVPLSVLKQPPQPQQRGSPQRTARGQQQQQQQLEQDQLTGEFHVACYHSISNYTVAQLPRNHADNLSPKNWSLITPRRLLSTSREYCRLRFEHRAGLAIIE
ncbi:unnamed protein product [Callosobruchus maculatus]|uniref:SH3 domain-containing protein n=1 Tax=Callosobruchus maculatus TaxID=64391 RepID=A0A653C3G1_CALMS|nr:unnamed protein product [Callosobruchus maculatus]